MAETPVVCPFCNALVPSAVLAAARPACPRCGDRLPASMGSMATGPGLAQPPAPLPSGRSVSRRRLIIWFLPLLLALLAVGYGLNLSGPDQPKLPEKPAPTQPQGAVDLPALGYVPPESNLVAVVRLDLLRTATQKQGLVLPKPIAAMAGTLAGLAGLELDLIDHAVLATTLAGDLPQLTVIVQTAKPYSTQAIARARQPQQPTLWRQRPVYRFKLAPMGEGLLLLVDQQTLIMVVRLDAVKIEDAGSVPVKPHAGLATLAAPLRDLVRQRFGPQPACWLAGHLEKPEPLAALLAFTPVAKEHLQLLNGVQTFGLSLDLHQGATLSGACRCRDAQAAYRLGKTLAGWSWPDEVLPVVGKPSQAEEDNWVSLQIRADGAAWLKLWEQLSAVSGQLSAINNR